MTFNWRRALYSVACVFGFVLALCLTGVWLTALDCIISRFGIYVGLAFITGSLGITAFMFGGFTHD